MPVSRFAGHHPADTSTRIGNVTGVTRDDVDVQLSDRLAGSNAVVETDVEALGFRVER